MLPQWCGGEVDPAASDRLEQHLAACAACRAEREEYARLIELARNSFRSEARLPDFARARIAAEAAAFTARRGWRRVAFPAVLLDRGRSAGLVASLAACLLAVLALPLVLREEPVAPVASAVPAVVDRIDMRLVGDKVRLAWSDGTNEAYRVYKSSDPSGLAGVEVHSVHGTVWIDENPASSPIVYYRIEAVDSPQF